MLYTGLASANTTTACVTHIEQREVRGQSMQGVFEPGDTINIQHGYYNCHPVKRGDVVVFEYSGNLGDGLYWVKTARGLPGDVVTLGEAIQNRQALLVNGKPVFNNAGEPYQVDKVGASYIRLAQQRQMRNNMIPRGRYLMLGTTHVSGWDSRRVGLIPRSYLIGKVSK